MPNQCRLQDPNIPPLPHVYFFSPLTCACVPGDAIAISTPSLKVKQRVQNAHMVFVTAAAVAPDGSALLTVRSVNNGAVLALVVNTVTPKSHITRKAPLDCGMRSLVAKGALPAKEVANSNIDVVAPHAIVSGRCQPMPAHGVRPSGRRRGASCREAPLWRSSSFSWPCSSTMR